MTLRNFEELDAAVTLSRLPGVGAKTFIDLIREHGKPIAALQAVLSGITKTNAVSLNSLRKKTGPIATWKTAADRAGAEAYWAGGPCYPVALLDLSEPPPVVFIKGVKSNSDFFRLCIVGARRASDYAEKTLCSFLVALAASSPCSLNRYEIISGAAAGIDCVAHRQALTLGFSTGAVLACGIDVRYPACNAALIDKIADVGWLLSELLPQTPPMRGFFPTRNRLLAALADAVIVIQASENSGSLITAEWARKLKKPLFVLYPPSDSCEWRGNRILLEKGALAIKNLQNAIELLNDAAQRKFSQKEDAN